jgi:dephospho-CoA kinase
MSLMIAVIGRYGVGKSLLCDYFLAHGMMKIDISEVLLQSLINCDDYDTWQLCMENNYNGLQKEIPLVRQTDSLLPVLQYINEKKALNKYAVVELPSFMSLIDLIDNAGFTHIVAVDCPEDKQQAYLCEKYNPEVATLLTQSSIHRDYYTALATDVFMNTVEKAHVKWVAGQIISTYKLCDSY